MSAPVQATLGKYQLVRKLAVGGMAEVYLAKVAGPGGFEKTLVLKRVLPHLAEDENFISMFRSEAKLAAQLNHPNVVSIFDFGQEGDVWFLVMEFIDGPNLRALFRRAFELGQPLPFNLAAKIVSAACEGLAYAHEFIDPETGVPMELVHRDISPDNILLGRNGGVKVVDFGIAKAVGQTHHTKTGTIKGKFSYMAPEQLRGQPLDRRADVFALGIVLYELIAGGKPFDTVTDAAIMQAILFEKFKPAADRRPDTPPELQRILDRALEKDRDARYADCREFQADLDNFIVSQGPPVGQHQLAQLVARLASPTGPTMATPSPRPSQPNLPRASPAMPPPPLSAPVSLGEPRALAPPLVPASLGTMEGRAHVGAPAPTGTRAVPIVAGFALVAVLAAGGLWWKSNQAPVVIPRPEPIPAPVVVQPVKPAVVEPVVVAPPEPVRPPAAPPVTPLGVELPPPLRPVAVRPTHPKKAITPPVIAVAPKLEPAHPVVEPGKVETGLVDFRVRPYASVFVNGTFYGVTPFAKVTLNVGTHTVKLVNKDIGKEITLSYEVKPGDNTLKYNLEAAE